MGTIHTVVIGMFGLMAAALTTGRAEAQRVRPTTACYITNITPTSSCAGTPVTLTVNRFLSDTHRNGPDVSLRDHERCSDRVGHARQADSKAHGRRALSSKP